MPPEVSVLMSVRDGGAFLAPAVESILGQSLTDLEFIIIDDGSGDGSWEMIQDFARRDRRIRALRNPANLGLAASLNRGLDVAQGRILARQDADDISLPQRLERQADFLNARPDTALLGTAVSPIDEQGRPLGPPDRQPTSRQAIRWKMLLFNAFHHPAVMLRRDALRGGLAYDPALAYAQDYDLWSRLLERERGANLPEALVLFRHHGGQSSKKAWARQQELADRVARANFARAGLADIFFGDEISLMRRAGSARAGLDANAMLRQLRLLRRFFAEADRRLDGPDPEWGLVKQRVWADLRRTAARRLGDAGACRLIAGLFMADPWGAVVDAARRAGGLLRKGSSQCV